jgi:hypothetical protein
MGYDSQTLHMIFIIIFMLLSLQSTHLFIAGSVLNAAGDFNAHGLQQLYLRKDNDAGIENHIQKVAGEDENEEKGALIVEKFRALLGLKSFHIKSPSHSGSEYLSPSPSPSPIEFEAPAPAPVHVPVLHTHAHPHPPPHHSSPILAHHKTQKEDGDKDKVRTILIATFVSAGAAFLVCALGLFWVCKKHRKDRKKPTRIVSVYSKKGGTRSKVKNVSAQNSASKVSQNTGLDLFYLNSLGTDLEQQACYLKQSCETVNTSSNHSTPKFTLVEREESTRELLRIEYDNASSSSTKEITSVHEDVESIKYESESDLMVMVMVINLHLVIKLSQWNVIPLMKNLSILLVNHFHQMLGFPMLQLVVPVRHLTFSLHKSHILSLLWQTLEIYQCL